MACGDSAASFLAGLKKKARNFNPPGHLKENGGVLILHQQAPQPRLESSPARGALQDRRRFFWRAAASVHVGQDAVSALVASKPAALFQVAVALLVQAVRHLLK